MGHTFSSHRENKLCEERTQTRSTSTDVVQRPSDEKAISKDIIDREGDQPEDIIDNDFDSKSTGGYHTACKSDDDCTHSCSSGKDEMASNSVTRSDLVVDWAMEQMYEKIQEVLEIFDDFEPTKVRICLTRYKWDKQPFLEAYCLGGESEFIDSVVVSSCQPSEAARDDCSRCSYLADVSKDFEIIELDCGHKLDTRCLTLIVLTKSDWEKEPFIKCLNGCKAIVSDDIVMKMTTAEAKKRYRSMMADSYVTSNRTLRRCPTPGCGCVIELNTGCVESARCVCKNEACLECGKIHEIVPCHLYRKWMDKYEDFGVTKLVEQTFTRKNCPNCHTNIEKNDGENEIECLNCKALFCWYCVSILTVEQVKGHRCNGTNMTPTEMRIAEFKHELQRFAYYYCRYDKHAKWSTGEKWIVKYIKAYQSDKHSRDQSYDSVYLTEAIKCLSECRRALQLTCIFSYFLEASNEKVIFEGNQRDLEQFVQLLFEILDSAVDEDKKCQTMHLTKYCEKRRKVLLDHVKEGYENDWWQFIDESRIDKISEMST